MSPTLPRVSRKKRGGGFGVFWWCAVVRLLVGLRERVRLGLLHRPRCGCTVVVCGPGREKTPATYHDEAGVLGWCLRTIFV